MTCSRSNRCRRKSIRPGSFRLTAQPPGSTTSQMFSSSLPLRWKGYLAAARRISRFAVGDPSLPAIIERYQMPFELPQDRHVSGLPFGTRGGKAIRTYVPLDAEYRLDIETARGATVGSYELEVSVDGERAGLFTVDTEQGRSRGGSTTIGADGSLEVSLSLKAGPRVLVVTFVDKPAAPEEAVKRAFLRTRGRLSSIVSVTLTGPLNATGSGDTPSRRRIFSCRPSSPAQEVPCAKEILSTLARHAYRRPVTEEDLAFLLPVLRSRPERSGLRTRHSVRHRAALGQSRILVSRRTCSHGRPCGESLSDNRSRTGYPAVILPVEQYS